MSSPLIPSIWLLLLVAFASACVGFPKRMTLERGFPLDGDIEAMKVRDRARHRHLLRHRRLGQVSAVSGNGPNGTVVDFPVLGSADPFSVGLYYTRVRLGQPAKEFYVQIDTGSDALWVSCTSCSGCPASSGLKIPLEFFDPQSSSSASVIPCSDQRCSNSFQVSASACSASTGSSPCSYRFQYGDGSGTSGFYVSDTLYLDTIVGDGVMANSSATVMFGCSNLVSGDLTKADRAVDGIFGFGQNQLSVISQLSASGMVPKVFSHCLSGAGSGGGTLVLGEIVEPGIVYSPLVPNQSHYNLYLQSIAVNGQVLPIASSVFATSTTQGTIIDSGTTLAYLADQAYDTFVSAISSSVSQSTIPVDVKGTQCYVTSGSVSDVFPPVTLRFQGASLVLRPEDYLLLQGSSGGVPVWCIGWQKNQGQGISIFGDIVLKDKIFVYDLAQQRIGWVNYDCTLPVRVSASSTGGTEFVNSGQVHMTSNSSPQVSSYKTIILGAIILLIVNMFLSVM